MISQIRDILNVKNSFGHSTLEYIGMFTVVIIIVFVSARASMRSAIYSNANNLAENIKTALGANYHKVPAQQTCAGCCKGACQRQPNPAACQTACQNGTLDWCSEYCGG